MGWQDSMVRAVAINAFVGTPPGRAFRERRVVGAGYDSDKDREEYVRGVFNRHWEMCGRPTSGAVLELGPGGNVDVARLFAEKGCEPVVCIDPMPYVEDTHGVEYRTESIEKTTLPDESFDVIYSHATLEHVFNPAATVRSIARLLKPGGRTSHVVDLRDHRDFSHPHDFLRYPQWLWKLAGSNRAWPNRWRAGDWGFMFRDVGLETEVIPKEVVPRQGEPLAPRFRGRKDLDITGIEIRASKPAA